MRRIASLLVVLAVVATAASAIVSDSYVLRDGDITYMLGKGMPAENLKGIQHRFGEHFLWACRGGKVSISTDAKTLREALAVLQRNVKTGPETDKRMATVVDTAIRTGAARQIRQ